MQPDPRARVRVEATVAPSEDPDKLLSAVKSVVGGDLREEIGRNGVKVFSAGPGTLLRLHDQFRDRHVRGAARRLLLAGAKGNSTTVMVNRQAATVGVVVLCSAPEESPLGPIYVTVDCRGIEAVIDWLTAYREG
ncbi:MAG: hypothetical protein ACHQYR_01510 [Candidatus Gagatemarchaeaceae archaeon]